MFSIEIPYLCSNRLINNFALVLYVLFVIFISNYSRIEKKKTLISLTVVLKKKQLRNKILHLF